MRQKNLIKNKCLDLFFIDAVLHKLVQLLKNYYTRMVSNISLKNNGFPYFLLCSIALSGSSLMTAASAENIARTPGRFDAIGAAGIAQVQAGNAQLGVTSSETDKLVQTNKGWNSFAGQLGLGYVFYARHAQRYSQKIQWFPSTEPELNAYYLGLNDIKGDVWRFNNANFNQLNYKTPINSTRLMFDEAVTIVSKKWLSLYAIGGVGAAWNHVGYSDSDKGLSCPDQRLVLNSNTSSNFSWEAGGGLSFLLGKRVSLTLEYLYTDLGTGQTYANGTTGTITAPVIVPASTNLAAQSGLLGLHIVL